MREYWMEFAIVAYAFTSIDLILTARGILLFGFEEGNALVTAIIPNGNPYQIPLMVITTILIYWTIFYACQKPTFNPFMLSVVSFLCLAAVGTHTFGISTWIFPYNTLTI